MCCKCFVGVCGVGEACGISSSRLLFFSHSKIRGRSFVAHYASIMNKEPSTLSTIVGYDDHAHECLRIADRYVWRMLVSHQDYQGCSAVSHLREQVDLYAFLYTRATSGSRMLQSDRRDIPY